MSAQNTIARLRADRLHLAETIVKTLRGVGASDEQIVVALREALVERPTVQDAIKAALARPGGGVTLDGGAMIEALAKARDSRLTAESAAKARAAADPNPIRARVEKRRLEDLQKRARGGLNL